MQPRYNLLDREFEWEIGPLAADAGLGVLPWSPLRGGWLTGRYVRGETAPAGSRIATADAEQWGESSANYDNERTWRILDELRAVAAETGWEPARVAISWLLGRPAVTAPIVGARTMAQLEADLTAADQDFDPAMAARLTAVSRDRVPPYPYDVLAGSMHSAARHD